MRIPIAEFRTPYGERPQGSSSKLRTISDGVRITRTIAYLLKEERRLTLFFAGASAVLVAVALAVGIAVVVEFARTGLVPRLPRRVARLARTTGYRTYT